MIAIKIISNLYKEFFGYIPDDIQALPPSGSDRKYFRLHKSDQTIIAAFNPDVIENDTFIYLSRHFKSIGLNVPEVIHYFKSNSVYFLEDLGNTTLFDIISKDSYSGLMTKKTKDYYKASIHNLIKFQVDGFRGLDFDKCYPRSSFDKQSIQWDLNYFKYFYLKPAGIAFNEDNLEDSFKALTSILLEADMDFFMYRDFQSRNIMIKNETAFFIDYQGGRKGPAAYDLVSLLFQAKANLSPEIRSELLEYYLENFEKKTNFQRTQQIREYYHYFILIRTLQVLGAYGFRGYVENKAHFLSSIPYAIHNLRQLLQSYQFNKEIGYLTDVLQQLQEVNFKDEETKGEKLLVEIYSFSYKHGMPKDYSGNGGGFVFDCRFLPNPGRIKQYKALTGKDKEVIHYLEEKQEVKFFIDQTEKILTQAIENYHERKFTKLMISFGCTGGQHRSVYCAEQLYKIFSQNRKIQTKIDHLMLND